MVQFDFMKATARAPANIALVKYWGKRDRRRNLPATGSLSFTLSGLHTTTTVEFDRSMAKDELELDGRPVRGRPLHRVSLVLDRVRRLSGLDLAARVRSENDMPAQAGLASSASAFAALALAAFKAAGLPAGGPELAATALLGSGSAPRSLPGGLVLLDPDGSGRRLRLDSLVRPGDWDLALVVALADAGTKRVPSTEGMERTRLSSPYYRAWLRSNRDCLARAMDAVARRDLDALGRETEMSFFRMHAAAMAADPPIVYLEPASIAAVNAVFRARSEGLRAWITFDAGPHPCVLCRRRDARETASLLAGVQGVTGTRIEVLGTGAKVVE